MQPLFITVDPEKDTPEQLKGYVALFHPRLIGLTGDAEAHPPGRRAYKVYYAKTGRATAADPASITPPYIFLMGRDGSYLGFFPPGTSADRMVEIIRPHVTALSQR